MGLDEVTDRSASAVSSADLQVLTPHDRSGRRVPRFLSVAGALAPVLAVLVGCGERTGDDTGIAPQGAGGVVAAVQEAEGGSVVIDTVCVIDGGWHLRAVDDFSRRSATAIGPTYDPGTLGRFACDGTQPQFFGGEGDGPGELRRPWISLFGPNDSVLVIELGAWTVFDPGLRPVRRVRWQGPMGHPVYGWVWLDDGTILGPPPGFESPSAFARYSADGALLVEFPRLAGPPSYEGDYLHDHILFSYPGGDRFWYAARYSTRVEEWTVDGDLIRVINVSTPYLAASLMPRPGPRVAQPQEAGHVSIEVTNDSLLWITTATPDPRRKPVTLERLMSGEAPPQDRQQSDYFIEVVDLNREAVIASMIADDLHDIGGTVISAATPGLRWTSEWEADGRMRALVTRLRVAQTTPRR